MKTQTVRSNKFVALSLVLAVVSFGPGTQAVNADTMSIPVTLTGDVVQFVDTNVGAALDATGNILDSSGNIVGVVYGPDGKVVHKVSSDKIVIVKQRGDAILSASLYNRLYDLQNLMITEKALGHLAADKYDALIADINDARADLDGKVSTGGVLSFEACVEIGRDLDDTATRVKSELNATTSTDVVYKPMVIVSDPAKKRISIYQRTVKTSDGVSSTTKTTTTEATE